MSNENSDYTPGLIRWELNKKSKNAELVGGTPAFDKIVMDFTRWGMGSAIPRFNQTVSTGFNVMEKADAFARPRPGREHHEAWHADIDHPDAQRLVDCWNACANIANPQEAIAAAREALEDWHLLWKEIAGSVSSRTFGDGRQLLKSSEEALKLLTPPTTR